MDTCSISSTSSSFHLNQSEDNSVLSDLSAVASPMIKGEDSDSSMEESETYFFESDHVALKGNHDYQMLLRSIAVLEAQRIQAVADLDRLYEAQEEALADPIQFVDKLQKGIDLKLPKQQKIASLPNIQWEKYTNQLDFSTYGVHKHMTRLKRNLVDGGTDENSQGGDLVDSFVRGRVKTESKPGTFNQLWTTEEQKRLEDFLIQFPPEEIESKRWQKIAAALGNRTPLQVQSRVQKYFIKLAKAGLPVPGRAPNLGVYKKKASRTKFNKYHKFYYQQSTFLQSYEPPVYMSDDDENSQSYEGSVMSANDGWDDGEDSDSDDERVPLEMRETPEYLELQQLKCLRREKLRQSDGNMLTEHVGFKCDNCDCEPIVGTRWHCTDCPPEVAVDFCDECTDRNYETETHNSSHRLKPKHQAEGSNSYADSDYLGFVPGGSCSDYNYLDPNYMPAS